MDFGAFSVLMLLVEKGLTEPMPTTQFLLSHYVGQTMLVGIHC